MSWLLWSGLGFCALSLATVGLAAYGARQWAAAMQVLHTSVESGRVRSGSVGRPWPTLYDARELEGLPAPVQRYFRAVLWNGQPIITAVTITMAGTFNMSATSEQWKPFTARQRVTTRRPGFVWDANISVLPGLAVRVVDSYVVGTGFLKAAVLGIFKVADVSGQGEIARGELMRWFAESAWYPTALLPSQGVQWAAVDDHSAYATIEDGPLSLSLLFRFDEAGLIRSFRAEARGAIIRKTMVMAAWEGNWSNYRSCDGMLLPFTGEVAWMRPEGRRPYFLGTVTAITPEFSH